MLVEKDTNRIILTAVKMQGDPIVTCDGIVLNNEYSLVYEIEGRKPVVFTLSGVDIAYNFQYVINNIDMDGELDLLKARRFLNPFVVLWGTLTTDRKLLKEIKDDYPQDYISFVKRAIRGNCKDKKLLNKYISAYLYIKLIERSDDESNMCYLHIVDYQVDEEMLAQLKDTWMDTPIAKRGEVTSYEQLCSLLSPGELKYKWVSDPKEVMQIH